MPDEAITVFKSVTIDKAENGFIVTIGEVTRVYLDFNVMGDDLKTYFQS